MRVALAGSSQRTLVKLTAKPYTLASSKFIDVLGTVVNLDSQAPVPSEPPAVPPVSGSDQPVVPPAYQPLGYVVPNNFNYQMLERLPTQPSDVLVTTVPATILLVQLPSGIIDFGDAMIAGSWSQPISGEARGEIDLVDVLDIAGNRLLDLLTTAEIGARVSWVQRFGDNLLKTVCNAYVVNKPRIEQGDEYRTLRLELGCNLSLLSKRLWLRETPYCGRDPKNVLQAVRIYESFLQTAILSREGHDLLEVPENFGTEKPYDYLQSLYAPTDQDVRCNINGIIEVKPRSPYVAGNELRVPVVTSSAIPDTTVLFSNLTLSNTFSKVVPFKIRKETFTELSPNYDVNNTKPWFLNGSWRKVTTAEYWGDTEVNRKEELYARFPNAVTYTAPAIDTTVVTPTPLVLADSSTCENGATVYATTERLISVVEFGLKIVKHISGAYLVQQKGNQEYGWQAIPNPAAGSSYDLVNGIYRRETEKFTNTPLENENACRKDWTNVITLRDYSKYERGSDLLMRLVAREIDAFADVSKESNLGEGLSRSVPRSWVSTALRGAFNEGYWVEQPSRRTKTEPTGSQWVRPTVVDVTVSAISVNAGIQRAIGNRPSSPGDAPFCYKPIQCQQLAARQIRDSYATANAVDVSVPYWKNYLLGESVDISSLGYKGQVYAITYQQDVNQAMQTLTLGKIEL